VSVIALSITRCSKSSLKFAVRVRPVTSVAMATTQLVLNQFKNFLSDQLRIEYGVSLAKIVSATHLNGKNYFVKIEKA